MSDDARPRATIRNAVLHMANEQPILADLFALPDPGDQGLLCTNLRLLNGKRPVFADDSASTFFFPYHHVRFIEIHPDGPLQVEGPAAASTAGSGPPEPEPEADIEIDEDFLRRIREV